MRQLARVKWLMVNGPTLVQGTPCTPKKLSAEMNEMVGFATLYQPAPTLAG